MSEIDPVARLAIAQIRSRAFDSEAVAVDLERAGIPAIAVRENVATLRAFASALEADELALAEGGV